MKNQSEMHRVYEEYEGSRSKLFQALRHGAYLHVSASFILPLPPDPPPVTRFLIYLGLVEVPGMHLIYTPRWLVFFQLKFFFFDSLTHPSKNFCLFMEFGFAVHLGISINIREVYLFYRRSYFNIHCKVSFCPINIKLA